MTEPGSGLTERSGLTEGSGLTETSGLTERLGANRSGGAPAPSGGWRLGVVREVEHPSPRSVLLRLAVPDRIDHLPGQHYVIRLTADDGYTASRSYSVASAPSEPLLEFYVERLAGGEVSGFLADVVVPGDELEVRGPIGGWFVWDGSGPALGVGGGSGVVPLVAMARHAADIGRAGDLRIVAAARTLGDLPYAEELRRCGAHLVLSRAVLDARPAGRLTAADLRPVLGPPTADPPMPAPAPTAARRVAFVCGSAAFAESASSLLVDLGVPAVDVRVERFGPSG